MSRSAKIALGVVGGFLALCLLTAAGVAFLTGAVIARAAELRPERVAATAGQIAQFTLPEGYHEAFSVSLMGASVVGIDAPNDRGHIYLATLPFGMTVEQMGLDYELGPRVIAGQTGRRYIFDRHDSTRVRPVSSMDRTIRGQNVTMVVSEGINSAGEPYREMAGMFNGRSGATFVQIAGPVSSWDQNAIDAFIASIS